MSGGMISLESVSGGPGANGDIGPAGEFELSTLLEDARLPGAVAGEYRATYIPAMSAAQTEVPIPLTGVYAISSGENHLELKLP